MKSSLNRNRNLKKGLKDKTNGIIGRVDKEKNVENDISVLVQESLLHIMKSKNKEERAEFIAQLPPSSLTSLFSQFIPKKKDMDQDLLASHISLVKSYEHLPGINDLTEHCQIIRAEVRRMENELRQNTYLMEKVFKREDDKDGRSRDPKYNLRMYGIRRRVLALIRAIQNNAKDFMEDRTTGMSSYKRWKDQLEVVLNEGPRLELTQKIMEHVPKATVSIRKTKFEKERYDQRKNRGVKPTAPLTETSEAEVGPYVPAPFQLDANQPIEAPPPTPEPTADELILKYM